MTGQPTIEEHPSYTLNPALISIELTSSLSLDLETSGVTAWKDKIRVIALMVGEQKYVLVPEYYSHDELTRFFKRVKDSKTLVVAHNAKFDCGFILCSYGVALSNIYCTMVASQVCGGGSMKYKHDLNSCLERELGIVRKEDKKEMQKSFLNGHKLTAEQLAYASADTEYLLPLMDKLNIKATSMELEKVIKLEMALLPVLVDVETKGCLIDVDAWRNKLKEWEIKKKECVMKLDEEYLKVYPYSLFAKINYSSAKQVIDLFKQLNLPLPTKEEQKGKEVIQKESADEPTLDSYLNEYPDSPLAGFILLLKEFREYDKLLSTYGESFLERIDSTGHIHTSYAQCSTTTGRLSSKSPNLQNIPSDKNGEGGIIRQYFIAPKGYKFITSDMAGAEIVIAADASKEQMLLKAIREGADMHSDLASISFSIIYGQPVKITKSEQPLQLGKYTIIPKEARDIHKSVTFSKFYKGGPKRVYQVLARYINQAVAPSKRMFVAKRISESIDAALPKLTKYLTGLIDKANEQGYLVTTKLGRRRYFDGNVYGEAANAPVQASNADAMKIAMINIFKKLGDKGRIVLTVHDEVGVIVKEEYAEEIAKMVKAEMAQSLTWLLEELQGDSSVKIADHWEK